MNIKSKDRDLTVLVMGGKGFVGSAVVTEASRRNLKVMVIGRDNYHKLTGTSCDILINADGNSRKYLATQDPKRDFDLSVTSTAQSLFDFKPMCYVYLSSIDVYSNVSDPRENVETSKIDFSKTSEYGFHKYLAEELVRYHASNWLIVRMGGFVGNGLWKNSIYDVLKRKPLRVHPDSEYQYLNTRDFAVILFDLIQRKERCEIFNIAGHGVMSLSEIASLIPDSQLPFGRKDGYIERYEVNIEKIKSLFRIPQTRDTVATFIDDVKIGKTTLK